MTENNEVLNQEQIDDEEDLFAGYQPSDTPDTTEDDEQEKVVDDKENEESAVDSKESKTTETNTDSQVASSQDQPFLTIKYNKEDVNLTKEEAIEFSQKGKNYDVILDRYNSLKENEGNLKEIIRLAKANNMTVKDYVNNLTEVQDAFEMNREVEALKQQYPNSDEELLKEVARSHINNQANLISKKQEEEANARKQEINRQLDVFHKRYPNVDPQKLDKSVYTLMTEGYTITEAYDSYLDGQRIAEQQKADSLAKIEQQNQENKAKSIGSTNNSDQVEISEFEKELFSD